MCSSFEEANVSSPEDQKHISELKAIQALEAEWARAEERLREIERIEENSRWAFPLLDSGLPSEERKLRTVKEMLSETIRKKTGSYFQWRGGGALQQREM
jgi:hypothetical protein